MHTDPPRDIALIVIQAPELKFATRLSSATEGERGTDRWQEDRQTVLMDDWTNSICICAAAFIFCLIIGRERFISRNPFEVSNSLRSI